MTSSHPQPASHVLKGLPRDIEGSKVGPLQHVLKRGEGLYFYLQREIVRRLIAYQGNRRVRLQRGIHEGQEPARVVIERDQRETVSLGGDDKTVSEGPAQVKPDTGYPFGRYGRRGDEAVNCGRTQEESGGDS
jgi:hypothetical protein